MSSMRVMNPRVKWFAEEMRKKLRKNTYKTESRDLLYGELYSLLKNEVDELKYALTHEYGVDIVRECADVANYAMMIADKTRNLGKDEV